MGHLLGIGNIYKLLILSNLMKRDIHNSQQRFENWFERVNEYGIDGLNKINSDWIIKHITDMRDGRNVAKGKKGKREYSTLNPRIVRLTSLFRLFERKGIKDISKITEDQLHKCFNEITKRRAIPGIPVRRNSSTRSRGSPSRRKAVLEQKRDIDRWKEKVQYAMRCVVESIFSGTKRRFGEYLFSLKEKNRCIEMWLRTILWNVLIYPR